MLRLLVALLSLAAAPLGLTLSAPTPSPDEPHAHGHDPVAMTSVAYVQPEPYRLVIDASAMPGETGWFLVPLTARESVSVDIETKHKQAHEPGRVQAAAIVIGDPRSATAMGGSGHHWRDAEANARGLRLTCCDEVTSRYPWSGASSSGGSSGGGAWLEPGETLWVGLVAAGWTEGSKLKITLTSWGAPLLAGQPQTGTNVEAVDLVDEARAAGTNVRLSQSRIAGDYGEAARAWSPAGTGLLLLDAYAEGESGARLTVTLPRGPLHKAEALHEESVGVMAFERGGTLAVRLAGLHEPQLQLSPFSGAYGYVHARALYADLSVPLEGFTAWHSPIVREDDDW